MAFLNRQNTAKTVQQRHNLYNKVHQLMQLSKYDRALEILGTVLEPGGIPPEYTPSELDILYQYYGICLVQSSRLKEAVEALSLGMDLAPDDADTLCGEALEELAIPAIQKHILEGADSEDSLELIRILETVSPDSACKAVQNFLSIAGKAYRTRNFSEAAAAYEYIIPLAERHGCLDFEDLIRAGDSCVKCSQLNKAWKLYKSANAFADTYSKSCRLHKKIADLLVIRNQDWHAIFHFLIALQAVPSDKGARTKLYKTLKRLGLEQHINRFLHLNTKHSDHKQLEISLMDLRKRLKAS